MATNPSILSQVTQGLASAGEYLGLYESELKKAYHNRKILDDIAPLVDSLYQSVEEKYKIRPNLYQEKFDRVSNIRDMFLEKSQIVDSTIKASYPKEPLEPEPDQMLGDVEVNQAQPALNFDQFGVNTTAGDTISPEGGQVAESTGITSQSQKLPDQSGAMRGTIEQGKEPTLYDKILSLNEKIKYGTKEGITNTANAIAQLPRVAGNLGLFQPMVDMTFEQRLQFSNDIGDAMADKLSEVVKKTLTPSGEMDYYKSGKLKRIEGISDIKNIEDAAQVISSNLPLMTTLMASYMFNPVAGTALMFGAEGGDIAQTMSEMEKETGIKISPANKFFVTAAVGGINAALEKVGFDQVLGTVLKPYRGRIIQALIGAGTEGVTEFLQEWTQILAEAGVKEDPKLENFDIQDKFKKFWSEFGKKENWEQSGLSGFVGAVTGGGISATIGGAQTGAEKKIEQAQAKQQAETVASQNIAKERRSVQRSGRQEIKKEKAEERRATVEAGKEKESQRQALQIDLFGKAKTDLTPIEQDAQRKGIPIIKKDGTPYSDVFLRRRLKGVKKQVKAAIPQERPEPTPETDILYKPVDQLTPQEKGELGKRMFDLVDQGYDEQKLNTLGISGLQKLLRGDIDEFDYRKFVEGEKPVSKEVKLSRFDAINKIVDESYEKFPEFDKKDPTTDATRYGVNELKDEDIPKIRAEIERLGKFAEGEKKFQYSEDAFPHRQRLSNRKQFLLEALSAKERKHINYNKGDWSEGNLAEHTKKVIESVGGAPFGIDITKAKKLYSTHESGISLKEIEESEVDERGNYTKEQFAEWKKKYNITDSDKVVWVSADKNIANQYNYGAEDRDEVLTGTNIEKFPIEVNEFTPDQGFIIPESDDGDGGYLFVLKPKDITIKTIERDGLPIKQTFKGGKLVKEEFDKKEIGFKDTKYFSGDALQISYNLAVTKYLSTGTPEKFANIKSAINEIDQKEYSDNDIQEMIEFGIQKAARQINSKPIDDYSKFTQILNVYNGQPRLSKRTSTKVINQQYSTPAPLAWLMGKLVGADTAAKTFDPTAGTGMLGIVTDPKKFTANEIDKKRVDLLKSLNIFQVENKDATLYGFSKAFDAVVMNPPFGKMEETRLAQPGDFKIKKLEHWIAVKGLEAMTDNGRAAILIGGNTFKSNFGKPTDKIGETDWIFFNWLYSNYNVVDHINIPGKLYDRQGTTFQTRLLVIDGRQKSDFGAPTKDMIKNPQSWEELYNIYEDLQNVLSSKQRTESGVSEGAGSQPGQEATTQTRIRGGTEGETGGTDRGGALVGEEGAVQTPGNRGSGGRGTAGISAQSGRLGGTTGSAGSQTGQPKSKGTGEPVQSGAVSGPATSIIDNNQDYGSENKLVSRDRAKELKERLSAKLAGKKPGGGELADSFDPEILSLGTELAAFHIEAGNKSFEDFSRAMIMDLGKPVVPYLKSFYMGARNFPGIDKKGMNNEMEVDRYDERGELDKLVSSVTPEVTEVTETQTEKIKTVNFEENQVASYLKSKNYSLGTVMPRNIYNHVKNALDKIEKEHGNIDTYVENKLQFKEYSSKPLNEAFGAEQIDNIAQAIYQMESGNGMIIGDMAGVGKGRVAAALLHYAKVQGQKPVFVTKQVNLFTDLWRDFVNIGITDMKPMITNVSEPKRDSNMYDEDGNLVHRALSQEKRKKIFNQLANGNKQALDDYDFIATTYSQANREGSTGQQAIATMSRGNFLVMDESHNAAGESNTGTFFKNVVINSRGTTFLSATFAKYPENMALYNNTILRAYDPEMLVEVMKAGGVPLQEIVSTALAQAGQYSRHERSYDGVPFEPIEMNESYEEDKRKANSVTEILRDMVKLDKIINDVVKEVDNSLKKDAKRMSREAKMPRNMRDHTIFQPFASRVHILVSQLLLSIKVDNAVQRATELVKQGKKVIITLKDTNEAALRHYLSESDTKIGEEINYDFTNLLNRALDRQLQYKIKEPNGSSTLHPIDWEGNNNLSSAVYALKDKIDKLFTGVTASPIDKIKSMLENNGLKTGEITGRFLKVVFPDTENPDYQIVEHRTKDETDKRVVLGKFNHGTGNDAIDVLIVNRSASTGLSAHADEKFKDQRPRTMITVQPELDINEMVQMFGRIFRTGQIHLPAYELLFTKLPLEIRPAAILMNKMKSLNANVSATQEGGTSFQVTDFMNYYGDKIAKDMVESLSSREQLDLFGKEFGERDIITARSVTGKLSIAPIATQEQFLGELEQAYNELIEDLNARGENKLITQEYDYKAETKSKIKVFAGPSQSNPLTADAFIETAEVNILKKPETLKQLRKAIAGNEDNIPTITMQIGERAEGYYKKRLDDLESQFKKEEDYKKRSELKERWNDLEYEYRERIADLNAILSPDKINALKIGNGYDLIEKIYESDKGALNTKVYTAVLTNVSTKKTGNPLAKSNTVLHFMTNDPARHRINVPLSKLVPVNISETHTYEPYKFDIKSEGIPKEWEETKSKTEREDIDIWTGNIFAAYTKIADHHDNVIRFTTKDGEIREGIIVKEQAKTDMISTSDMDIVFDYIKKGKEPIVRPEQDENFKLAYTGEDFKIIIPSARANGGKYYTDKKLLELVNNREFRQEGVGTFSGNIPLENEAYLKKWIADQQFTFNVSRVFIERAQDNQPSPSYSALADMGGYAQTNESLIEMPEIVEIAKKLLNGKTPRVKKKLRAAGGKALGAFVFGANDRIELSAKIFEDPLLARKVLSHEIGHVIDSLPSKDMARGNLLGRMATLSKQMYGWYSGYYNNIIDAELKELTHIWKPFDPSEDKKYTKYRYSSKELYADAISVLFNDPSLLQETAPLFHKGFFEFLDRKPNVKNIYRLIQSRIKSGWADIQAERLANRRAAFERGEEKYIDTETRIPLGNIKDHLKKELYTKLIDKNSDVIFKRNELRKKGINIDPENDPVYWLEELPYVSSQVFQYLRDINDNIKQHLKENGLTEADLGDYLFLNRAATERQKLANPWGYSEQEATEGLEYLRKKMGAEQFGLLENIVESFRKLRAEKITAVMEESEMYSDELMEIINDNENYATFQVQHYLEQKYGSAASGWIYKQIGTLADITNPFTATILKDAAILRAANRKKAAESVVNMLRQYFPDEVREAKKEWQGDKKGMVYVEPTDPKLGMIAYMEKGKMKAYWVDKHIADSFKNDPYEAGLMVRGYNALYSGLKNIFVSKNPFWAFWNTQRDLRAAALKLPKANMIKMIYYAVKSLPDAYQDVFLGNSTKIVRDLYEERALLVGRYYRAKAESYETEAERMLENYTINPKKYKNVVHKAWSMFMDVLELPGKFSERLFKIAGAKYLIKMGIPRKEALHMVRARSGSPDFYRRAQWTRGLNNIFMFSNAGKEGWRSSIEAFNDNKSSFTWKLMKYSILPKIAMWGGSIGLLATMLGHDDDELQEMYANIPDHDMQNYFCVPLWLTENNKTVYLVFPDDFSGQVVNGLLWTLLSKDRGVHLAELFDFVSGELPYSSLNPIIQFGFDTLAFFSGKNFYDEWRGELAINKTYFDAGGKYSLGKFAKYQSEKLGLGNYYRFPYDNLERNQSEIEELMNKPVLGGALRRFVRVSDRGRTEKLYRAAEKPKQERAISNIEMGDVIREHLNKTKDPGRSDARKLYVKLRKEGMDVGEKFHQRFWPKYMATAIFRDQPAVIRAFNSANTNEEKAAVLEAAYGKTGIDKRAVKKFKHELKKILK